MEETKLIRKLQKTGKSKYANCLIKKYYDEIYVYAYKQTSDKDNAMDITQEIFISMLKSISRYDSEKSSFRTWLYRVATNKTIDALRSNKNRSKKILYVDEIKVYDEKEFIKEIEENDLIKRLQQYINTLDTDSQQIFRLKFYGECTFKQIAQQLGIKEPTVKTKYYRLINQVRKEFKDE